MMETQSVKPKLILVKMQNVQQKDLKKLVEECEFLDENDRRKWSDKADKLSGKALEFTYKKFKDAKNKIENIYISIALQYDPTGGDLTREALRTIQETLKKN